MQNLELIDKVSAERLSEIVVKEKDSLNVDEVAFLKAREFYLDEEEKKKFFEVEKVEVKKVGRKKK